MPESDPSDVRTRLFQSLTERYPTRLIHRSRLVRGMYRLLLELVRPAGTIVLRTPDYRLRFRRVPRRNIARYIAIKRAYEPLVTRVWRECLASGGLAVDVGANIGHFTLVAALALGDRGHVVSFEPVPELHEELLANLAVNGIANVTAVQAAVGARDGEATVYRHTRNPGGHSLAAATVADGMGEPVRVPLVSLDGLLERERPGARVAAIKIDVEGAELGVLTGARSLLARHRPEVIFEFWPWGITRAADDPAALLALLAGLGYRFRSIDERRGRIEPAGAAELVAGLSPQDRAQQTYVLATP